MTKHLIVQTAADHLFFSFVIDTIVAAVAASFAIGAVRVV